MVEIGKKYNTRGGLTVKIVARIPNDTYPFIGYMVHNDLRVGVDARWKANGKYWWSENESKWDLIGEMK